MHSRRPIQRKRSRGAIIPLTAIALVGLCGMLALSIDLGMYAVAQSQVQDAADAAAVAGVRSLSGSSTASTLGPATTAASNQAITNKVLGSSILASEVTVQHGAYHY